MPQRRDAEPEKALTLALVLVGGAMLVALILIVIGVAREDGSRRLIWYGIGLAAVGIAVAVLILERVRRLRRQRRPEWLETQAWHQEMAEQIRKGHSREGPGREGGGDEGT